MIRPVVLGSAVVTSLSPSSSWTMHAKSELIVPAPCCLVKKESHTGSETDSTGAAGDWVSMPGGIFGAWAGAHGFRVRNGEEAGRGPAWHGIGSGLDSACGLAACSCPPPLLAVEGTHQGRSPLTCELAPAFQRTVLPWHRTARAYLGGFPPPSPPLDYPSSAVVAERMSPVSGTWQCPAAPG